MVDNKVDQERWRSICRGTRVRTSGSSRTSSEGGGRRFEPPWHCFGSDSGSAFTAGTLTWVEGGARTPCPLASASGEKFLFQNIRDVSSFLEIVLSRQHWSVKEGKLFGPRMYPCFPKTKLHKALIRTRAARNLHQHRPLASGTPIYRIKFKGWEPLPIL